MAINLVSALAKEVIQEVRQGMVQQSATCMTGLTKETELIRTLDIFSKNYTKLADFKKHVEEEKVKLSAELEVQRRIVVNLIVELEGFKEELKTYKELPSTLKQRQIDNTQLEEELRQLKAKYQKACESLVRLTSVKKDLSQECFQHHKDNEKLKNDIELLKMRLHEACYRAQSS